MGVALRDIIAEYKIPVTWEALPGIAAVDAHNALYQFLTIIRQPDGTPLMDQRGRVTSHLSGILFRTSHVIEKGIRPVYVFDGTPPPFKQATIESRRMARDQAHARWEEAVQKGDDAEAYKQARSASKVDAEVIATAKTLIRLLGLPFVDAPSEGEAQAAAMVAQGDARYVVSQDYDTLLFGAPLLVRNLTVSGKRKLHGRTISVSPEKIILSEVLKGLSLTRDDLIRVGILTGTDFNTGARGIGAKTALKIVRKGEFEKTLDEKLQGLDCEAVLDFFLHPPVTGQYSLSWDAPDHNGVMKMLCDGYDFDPDRVEKALEGMHEKKGQKTLDAWF
jgi:flap endonuclease-1